MTKKNVPLTLFGKLKNVIRQKNNFVLYREKGTVTPLEVIDYDKTVIAQGFNHLPEYMVFSSIVYETQQKHLPDYHERTMLPDGWQEITPTPTMQELNKISTKNKIVDGLHYQVWHNPMMMKLS